MKFLKIPSLLLVLCWSASTLANSAVAFVHGTGKQTDAYTDYWTGDFVQSVMNGNGNKYVVINCDFDQYMWKPEAAGCLAEQLSDFIDNQAISALYVITHSNGGNVIRWIMSNPTLDSRYPGIINAIQQVTAIAPSSKGTPLADASNNGTAFEQSVGWLLGYTSDAVRQQQVGWMAQYNNDNLYGTAGRPALPKPFKAVIGSDVDSAIWDTDSYCGGYQYQLGLEITQNWLDDCSDGFLECSSQAGAGSVWFYDKSRTKGKEPLSHHQSRRDCFNLDKILRDDI